MPWVCVTGASSGIGFACAELLARHGFSVLAGVRSPEAAEMLRQAHPQITAVQLDVTSQEDLHALSEHIHSLGGTLGGLVNNAGIAVPGPLEQVPEGDLRQQFEVNVLGLMATTRVLLPALRKGQGRIVNMSSMSGRIAFPLLGAYAASKFAVEALSDSLRLELYPWGISVSLIEPGAVRTPIWQRSERMGLTHLDTLGAEAASLYETPRRLFGKLSEGAASGGIEPDRVARCVLHALQARRPRARYPIGKGTHLQLRLNRWLPTWVRDGLLRRAFGLGR